MQSRFNFLEFDGIKFKKRVILDFVIFQKWVYKKTWEWCKNTKPSKLEHEDVLIKLEVNAWICIRIVEIRFVVVA